MTGYSTYNTRPSAQSPREEEALALRLTARTLREASSKADRNRALNTNHRIWSAIFRELNSPSCALPPILRSDLLRLAMWSMNYSNRAVLTDLPLAPLAEMNMDVAEGLDSPPPPPVSSSVGRAPIAAPAWV